MSRSVDDEVLAGGGEPATLEALKEANQQLRLASDQLHAILDQGLFMARLELDGTLIHVNRSALEVPGFTREQVFKRLFWDCGWWNRAPEVQEWVKDAVRQAASGVPFRGDSRYFWADGSEHNVDFACIPIRDAGGKVVVLVATGMDITERVHAEEHRRALEEQRLRSDALAVLDRAKTEFFSNVSHEFRTPLALMLGPLDSLLSSQGLGEEARMELERVQRNGQRLLKLVNMLLDFSRIEAGRIQASFEPVDLAALTVDLASTFRSLMENAGLDFVVDCPPLAEPVWVDREMYEKVVLNLLSNAFKFTFEGEVHVALRQRAERVELSVRDTGTGVAPEELPRLFERFHRVQGAKGRSYEGSGIGLALVQELVKLHGGSVHAQSNVVAGTTFTVSLPLGNAHLPKERVGAAKSLAPTGLAASAFVNEAAYWSGTAPTGVRPGTDGPSPAAAPSRTVGGRILLADDNADMREYVRRLLEGRFTVEAVGDGHAALEAARERTPDLVLSDVMMPGLDGFGLLKELRADPRTAHVPVVLVSARAGAEATIEGLTAGANDYLVKPFSAQELLARVEGNVRTAQARQDLDAFAGRIAHDLRNLLSPLPIVASQMKAGDERMRKAGERMVRITRRAQNLLDGMLAFSRAVHTLDPAERVSVPSVVVDVVEDLNSLRSEVDADLDVIEVEDVEVALPRGLLYVVLLNLLQNALKFIQGSPERKVKLSVQMTDGWCEMRIADTGPGIAPEVLPHIFEPFYRAPGSKASGYGIGLATVQRIVRAAGGEVRAMSSQGQGTALTVRLPRPSAEGPSTSSSTPFTSSMGRSS